MRLNLFKVPQPEGEDDEEGEEEGEEEQ